MIKMFFLSQENKDNELLHPRVPKNYLTSNKYEDYTTKRVCFAPSIDKALMALSENLKGKEFFVHIPRDINEKYVYAPSLKQVPDRNITGELWYMKSVSLSCIGKIKVIKDKGLDGHKFKYGDNKEAELYDWEWEWEFKYDSDGNIISEACLADFLRGDKKDCMYVEKTLTSEERNKLKDSDFGIPELRKYPLIDKSHVLSAMRYFKDCPEKYKAELAKRIQAKVDKFNLGVNKAGEYYKYIHQDVITESYILNKDDFEINFDEWKNDKPNKALLITGFCGAGKSTLSRQIVKEEKVKYVELDKLVDQDLDYEKNLNQLKKVISKYKDTRCVIEGFQIFYYGSDLLDILNHKYIIIKGTSMIKSLIRRIKRDGRIERDLKDLYPLLKDYSNDEKILSKFKDNLLKVNKYIKENTNEECNNVNESSILVYGENDVIQESTKYQKKYECPFCEFRGTREELVDHVEDEHQDMIPQDFTAARVVFNHINHKEHGTCVVCGRETKWREENRKYARLCGRKECSKALSDKADENLKRVTGMTAKEMLKNPEFQNKMLKGRSISGVYTFTDGGKRDYVGSYEKNILEYFDKTLHAHSSEVMTPGPVVEYVYKGEKHFWITDIYYITANLAIDAKDGGSNPNNRNMKEYREKQIAKEKAITDQGKYNYLRLTDNNFAQLLQILAELKYMMLDDDTNVKPISRIHEYTALGGMNPVIGSSGNYIVNYGINNTLIGQAYTNDKAMSKLFIIKDGKIQRAETKEFIENYDYTLYKHDSEMSIVKDIEDMMYNESEVEEGFFLKLLCNINNSGMIWVNEHFEEVDSMYDYYAKVHEVIENSLIQEWNKSIGNITPSIECLSEETYSGRDIIFKEDMNGVYAENVNTNMRTGYYENASEISDAILKILREG